MPERNRLRVRLLCTFAGLLLASVAAHADRGHDDPGHHRQQEHGEFMRTKGPPPHAPAHGYRAKHNYRYFPGAEVYFDVDTKLYFYLNGGAWVSLPKPPPLPGLNLQDFVKLELDTDKPYLEHEAHVRSYPAKHREKGRSGHDRGHDR